jgi:4'-phosphopantetheinyl transferase
LDLWIATVDEAIRDGTLERARSWLSEDEAKRWARFHFERDRNEYLLGRALVRGGLSRYAPVSPPDWVFAAGPHGKPSIAAPLGLGLEFNLSHSGGTCLLGVTQGHPVGVDIERVDRAVEPISLAPRVFSPVEQRCLGTLSGRAQIDRFFEYWTLKEAIIKARGDGFSAPLRSITVTVGASEAPSVAFEPALCEDPRQWHLGQLPTGERHRAAWALRLLAPSSGEQPVDVDVRRFIPDVENSP